MPSRSEKPTVAIAILVLFACLLSFTRSAAYAENLKKVSSLSVFDANNKRVGVANLEGVNVQVTFKMSGQLFAVGVVQDRFKGNGGAVLNFQAADCSGTPLMAPNGSDDAGGAWLLPLSVVAPPGSTVYIADPHAASQSMTVGSYFDERQGCQAFASTRPALVPALPVIDLDTRFTPPFSLHAK